MILRPALVIHLKIVNVSYSKPTYSAKQMLPMLLTVMFLKNITYNPQFLHHFFIIRFCNQSRQVGLKQSPFSKPREYGGIGSNPRAIFFTSITNLPFDILLVVSMWWCATENPYPLQATSGSNPAAVINFKSYVNQTWYFLQYGLQRNYRNFIFCLNMHLTNTKHTGSRCTHFNKDASKNPPSNSHVKTTLNCT